MKVLSLTWRVRIIARMKGSGIYGHTLYIDNIPYYFEKYIPTDEELKRFKKENEGDALFSKGWFLYRLVPFVR